MQSQRRVRGRCRRWRSVAVPRDGWWRSSGDAHQRTPTSGREHTIYIHFGLGVERERRMSMGVDRPALPA